MGYTSHTSNPVVDAAINAAEGTCQVAVAAAGNSQAAVTAAEIAFYRAAMAVQKANDISTYNMRPIIDAVPGQVDQVELTRENRQLSYC
jgi:hypothetical protein